MTGTARVEEIVARAARLRLPAVALTDTNNLYNAISFYKQAREAGIKPIIGVEVTAKTRNPPLVPRSSGSEGKLETRSRPETENPKTTASGPIVLLARDLTGYGNLCRIITRRNLEPSFDLVETVARFGEGLIILTENTVLAEALADKVDRESLYLELAAPGRSRTRWGKIAEAARRLDVGLVAGGDVYLLDREDHELHTLLAAVRENRLASLLKPGEVAHPESFLMTSEEMSARFADYPEALANTLKIAESCTLEIPMGKPIFPKCRLPAGETPYSYLYRRCMEGLAWRYRPVTQAAVERLTYELSLIDRLGFSVYFVIVGDILRHARECGIPSVGRGSGASSIVSYILGITNVDPIRYNLPFERFLNPGRTDCPDLDIDVCWRKRDEVIRYVYETWGADHVAMISTHNCFRRRSAFRELAKACGIAPEVVDRISKRMSLASVEDAVRSMREGNSDLDVDDATLERVVRYARRIEGFPHHLSIHCGGIVISDRTIDCYVPLEEAAKGIAITQYEMHAIEDVGLVKIDLLGNRALSTIRETVEILRRDEGAAIDVESLPEDDAETFALVRSGRTVGCCQLESPAMRHLLLMLQPESVRRIIQALALIRPAPASCGMKEAFVRRARGLEETTFPHPALEDVLGDTYGIMLYEDDAMLIAARLAGLSLERGDRLRKAIKRAAGDEDLRRVTKHFLRCALDNGVPLETAKDMWVQMAKFNEYSFCRAHAAGYGLVAYQSAYLKAHHPAAYMTAALNNVQGLYPRRVHLWEAKRMGVEVRGPCVNHSGVEFTHERNGGAGIPARQPLRTGMSAPPSGRRHGAIRVGLNMVKGLTQHTMDEIVGKRGLTPFSTLRDFMERVHAGLSELESLILVGAFDFTGRSRPELVWQARAMFGKVKTPGGSALGALDTDIETPTFPPFSLEQKVNYELEILECPLSAHPVELVRRGFSRRLPASASSSPLPPGEGRVRERRKVEGRRKRDKTISPPGALPSVNGFARATDLGALVGKRIRLVGILDTTRGTETKNGDLMQFLTLEDETGIFEVTLFPKLYRRVRRCLTDGGPYLVEGTVDSQYDSLSVRASRVQRFGAAANSR